MRAMCSDRPRGFTLPELVSVLLLISVLAAVVLPRFDGALLLRNDAWRDEVLAALRSAHQTALSHRRLVCADIAATEVRLRIAAANPASACNSVLAGPDGALAATSIARGTSASVAPAGPLYFQPSGRITSDGAGLWAASRTFTIAGADDIVVIGETGLVR